MGNKKLYQYKGDKRNRVNRKNKFNKIQGETQTGFQFTVSDNTLNDYETLEILAEMDDNPLAIPKLVKKLLGDEQTERLKRHIRDLKGFVDVEAIGNELTDIFNAANTKK